MNNACRQCGNGFEITESDLAFYERVSPVFGGEKFVLPAPSLCPDCRRQKRLAFRNERKLYHRKCDATGKEIISVYSPDKKNLVYASQEWWGDNWDPLKYGRDFDFSRKFADQFKELLMAVPRPSHIYNNSENSEYTNFATNNKNCYLLFQSSDNQDSFYSYWIQQSNNCVDVAYSHHAQYCLMSLGLKDCHQCFYSYNCKNSSNLYFCENLISSQDCFGCKNLSNKKYCIFNEQKTKEEYEVFLKEAELNKYSQFLIWKKKSSEFLKTQPSKYANILNCEDCSGDLLQDAKNCQNVFHGYNIENLKYCEDVVRDIKDSMDVSGAGKGGELLYECVQSVVSMNHCLFATFCRIGCNDVYYSDLCVGSNNLFGCVGLKKKSYCIFNKQYTKEEYEKIVPQIIQHMIKTGEWGEFFPIELSLFGYNETHAMEFYPLTKEAALKMGATWQDEQTMNAYHGPVFALPDDVQQTSDDIAKQIIKCKSCSKNYKIIAPELVFYKQMNLAVPRKCFDCRHSEKMQHSNSRRLYDRQCEKCHVNMKSTFAPDRPEKVYCEKCYLEIIY